MSVIAILSLSVASIPLLRILHDTMGNYSFDNWLKQEVLFFFIHFNGIIKISIFILYTTVATIYTNPFVFSYFWNFWLSETISSKQILTLGSTMANI